MQIVLAMFDNVHHNQLKYWDIHNISLYLFVYM